MFDQRSFTFNKKQKYQYQSSDKSKAIKVVIYRSMLIQRINEISIDLYRIVYIVSGRVNAVLLYFAEITWSRVDYET